MTVVYPWMLTAVSPPGQVQQTLYNRVVSIYRMNNLEVAPGQDPYSGVTAANLTLLFSNLPANIQLKTPGSAGKHVVPSDISTHPQWVIFISAATIAQYAIRDRDIVQDDESYRYGVAAAVWSLFGYTLQVVRLEA